MAAVPGSIVSQPFPVRAPFSGRDKDISITHADGRAAKESTAKNDARVSRPRAVAA
jgi:hypothetical protein